MPHKLSIPLKNYLILVVSLCIFSCSKKESSPSSNPPDPCTGKTITITPTAVAPTACGADGSISVAATGSTNFTYKLNTAGTYQAASVFNNISAGTYTVFVKDGAGCEKSASVTITPAANAGPLFAAVKNLITAKCQSCHNNTVQNGGMNWAVDCNIVANQLNIKNRAVELGTMPPAGPLTPAEKDIITIWINAGGSYSD